MKTKPKTPLQRFLQDAWFAFIENSKWKRAMRNLTKLEWSTDFVIYLLQTADRKDLKITIENSGTVLTIEKVKDIKPEFKEPEGIKAFKQYIGALDEA